MSACTRFVLEEWDTDILYDRYRYDWVQRLEDTHSWNDIKRRAQRNRERERWDSIFPRHVVTYRNAWRTWPIILPIEPPQYDNYINTQYRSRCHPTGFANTLTLYDMQYWYVDENNETKFKLKDKHLNGRYHLDVRYYGIIRRHCGFRIINKKKFEIKQNFL